MCPKDAGRMASGVDPNQTVPQSVMGIRRLPRTVCLKTGSLRYMCPFQKNPLGTITNSPVKKPQPEGSDSKLVPPQRTLSLKRSPALLRTRRKAKEEEEQMSVTEQEDDAPECKVS